MRLSAVLLAALTVILTPLVSSAQIHLPSFAQLCEYESDCRKVGTVKNRLLNFKRPRPDLIPYYARIRSIIIKVATEYQVDAVTLVLTPIAENTMNVRRDDQIADAMIKMGLSADDGSIAGMELSFGPGQIYMRAAKHVEPLAATIERRPIRTKKEIKQALITPEGALRYAAAIIRDAQDVYAAGGVDISKRPEILATLYNIGRVEQRLRDSRGRQPLPNYFGYFVGLNYRFVQEALDLPTVLQ